MKPTRLARPTKLPKDRLLPRLTMAFFNRPKTSFLLWLVLIVFGVTSYAVLLKREGFPSVNIPIAIVQGTYIVNDPAKVDQQIAKPISNIALKQAGVTTVTSQSGGNFYSVVAQFSESTDSRQAVKQLQATIERDYTLPAGATIQYNVPYFGVTGADPKKIDALVSLYDRNPTNGDATAQELSANAKTAVGYLNAHKPALVKDFFVRDPLTTATDPATGQSTTVQESFNRTGIRSGGTNQFYSSVSIGVTGVDNVDVIKLDEQLKPLLAALPAKAGLPDYQATIISSDSNAAAITQEISELQRVLLEGLLAVLVIGSIVIAVRASFITVISMITVVLATLGLLYLVGYTLNVITLFALILGLSLIVDDTIIMVEAIDASRRRAVNARIAIRTAVRKISRAMVAATLTATVSFAPLLFVGGVLGSFIRAIPITIISALLISLLVALIFIPLFARGLLLRPKQLGKKGVVELAAGIEARVAAVICRPMLWARGSTKKLLSVGLTAVLISFIFIGAAGFIFSKVTFNIFPPSKDSNEISVTLRFPAGATIQQAERTSADADRLIARTLGDNFESSTYDGSGSAASATTYVNLKPYDKRSVTSPELVAKLQQQFDTNFTGAMAMVGQVDVGPPASGFTVQIKTEDQTKGYTLAQAVASYLKTAELTRPSGTTAGFKQVSVANPSQLTRSDGALTIDVTANFTADDTTTLVTLAQEAIKKEFSSSKLSSYDLNTDALQFNIGQESENQDSFKSLAIAFPLMLAVIYLLLLLEFRSLLQPLLIFMAIPFSLFGITVGLYLTNNAFSFFAALGFFALIGLSLKNTILLTDYANQARRSGSGAIDSAVAALGERFRPLIATSLTAIVSLIPLAITSPFWQGLAVVLIFGLASSTLLVILIFPYYYLGGEFLRAHISPKSFFLWLIPTVILIVVAAKLLPVLILPIVILSLIAAAVLGRQKRRRQSKHSVKA